MHAAVGPVTHDAGVTAHHAELPEIATDLVRRTPSDGTECLLSPRGARRPEATSGNGRSGRCHKPYPVDAKKAAGKPGWSYSGRSDRCHSLPRSKGFGGYSKAVSGEQVRPIRGSPRLARASLGGSRSGGPDARCDADGNQQENDRRATERTGHHGDFLENAPPRPAWAAWAALRGKWSKQT